jgi:hypothetical protein
MVAQRSSRELMELPKSVDGLPHNMVPGRCAIDVRDFQRRRFDDE